MKELSIEEKAQRYDEAVNKAKSKIKNDKDHVLYEDDVIEIFPELKESEGERIRKALIYHYRGDGCMCTNDYRIDYKNIRTWLEKQGEQEKSTKEKLMALSDGKQHLGWLDDADKVIESEQKPVEWSEEDKEMIDLLIAIFTNMSPNGYYKVNPIGTTNMQAIHSSEIVKWLKSFKHKVVPQPYWKPTAEQLAAFGCAASYVTDRTTRITLDLLYKQLKAL